MVFSFLLVCRSLEPGHNNLPKNKTGFNAYSGLHSFGTRGYYSLEGNDDEGWPHF